MVKWGNRSNDFYDFHDFFVISYPLSVIRKFCPCELCDMRRELN